MRVLLQFVILESMLDVSMVPITRALAKLIFARRRLLPSSVVGRNVSQAMMQVIFFFFFFFYFVGLFI